MSSSLVLMLALLIILTIVAFFWGGKRLYSPSVIFCSLFTISAFFALIGNTAYWHEDVSFLSTIIIVSSLFVFIIGERLSYELVKKIKRRSGANKNASQNIDPEATGQKRFINKRALLLLGLCLAYGFTALLVEFFFDVKLAQAEGYIPYRFDLLKYLRIAIIESGRKNPLYVVLLSQTGETLGIVFIFLFFYVLFHSKKRIESLLLLPQVIPTLLIMVLSTARVGFILIGVFTIASFFINLSMAKKRVPKRVIVILVALLAVGFFSIYAISGASRGAVRGLDSLINNIVFYVGGSIVAFDKFLRGASFTPSVPFGAESFFGVYYLLGKVFSGAPTGIQFNEFVHLANGQSLNTYTIFRSFIADFGIVPSYLLTLGLGFYYGTVYQFVRQKTKFSYLPIYYGLILFYLALSVFSKNATASLLTEKRLAYVTAALFFTLLIRLYLYGKDDFVIIKKIRGDNSIKLNLILSFVSQFVVLFSSVFVSLLFPKFLDKATDFASWQFFILLTGFVGVFHFGFCDGIYVNFGGLGLEQVEKKRLKQLSNVFFTVELIVAFVIVSLGAIVLRLDLSKGITVICIGVYALIYNFYTYLGYIFQATNHVKVYSFANALNKVLFIVGSGLLLLLGVRSFVPYILTFTGATLIATIFMLAKGHGKIVSARIFDMRKEDWLNFVGHLKAGILLMLGALSSSLILGVSKYISEFRWGSETFSDVAYALSLLSIFMAFIGQLCIVLFPILKQKGVDTFYGIYQKMNVGISIVVPLFLLLYYPASKILTLWLPQYGRSIYYLGLILPLILYEVKTQLLCITYFKVMKRDKAFFIINSSSFLLSAALCLVSAYALNNVDLLVFSACVGIVFQNCLAQIVIGRAMQYSFIKYIVLDVCIFVQFALCNYFLEWWIALLCTVGALSVYYAILHHDVREAFVMLKERRRKPYSEKGEEA